MQASARDSHNRVQRRYFDTVDRPRLAVADTPYIRRHVDEVIRVGQFPPGAALLEIGAGLGKCTIPLITRGFDVTANDLSPLLLERLRGAVPHPIPTVACDIVDIAAHVSRRFDGVVGFFVLHHLLDFESTFRALLDVLRPGGRMAFCEPVGSNPLYYLQIAMTPGMRFSGEPSLASMRPRVMLPLMRRAGLMDVAAHPHGYFPPFLKNTPAGDRAERWLERRSWLPVPHAFQVFTGRAPA